MSEPRTRAESTDYRETSTYADVMAFVAALDDARRVHVEIIGTTGEGRGIPLVVAARPQVTSAAAARVSGKPIVYVQANIHAGEVEGKEAVLALLRDLTAERGPSVLDRVVLAVCPIYNADGNERFAAQSVNRTEQNGPERVGTRANAAGLDLNRDYMKVEAPETRASLRAIAAWQPDLFVDLHTTNGSYHGYALTYAPSLDPSAAIPRAFAVGTLLPAVRERLERRGVPAFDYGNFSATYAEDPTAERRAGWWSYDHRPRFGTNYAGLRGRLAVLSEAYSHDPFRRRVESTRAFVEELLRFVDEHAGDVRAVGRNADAALAAGRAEVSLRAHITPHPFDAPVLVERLERVAAGTVTEPGVPPGIRRTGRITAQVMPVYDHFEPTLTALVPQAYAFPANAVLVERLRDHGIAVEPIGSAGNARVERFRIGDVVRAEKPFQGHHETQLAGMWRAENLALDATWVRVDARTPLGVLAARLLEPQSDDGLVAWERAGIDVRAGDDFPVVRIVG